MPRRPASSAVTAAKIAERRGLAVKRSPGARHFHQDGASGGIVHRAVINGVAVYRRTDSQMIPVRGEHHRFRSQLFGSLPGTIASNIAGLDLSNLSRHVSANVNPERDGTEIARIGGLQHFIHVVAGHGE